MLIERRQAPYLRELRPWYDSVLGVVATASDGQPIVVCRAGCIQTGQTLRRNQTHSTTCKEGYAGLVGSITIKGMVH